MNERERIVEVMAKAVQESSRMNKRHECTRPELPKAMSAQVSDDALTALTEAGYAVVPLEPTEAMHHAARDWSRVKYGKPIGLDASEGCYTAMIAAHNA